MIAKVSIVDSIEVTELGPINIRLANKILEDGVEIARTYHRHCIAPGDDVKSESDWVQKITTAIWTKDVVDAYNASRTGK